MPPAAPPASPTKPFSVDHMLGQASSRQQVFECVRMMARNEVYLRCAQLVQPLALEGISQMDSILPETL